ALRPQDGSRPEGPQWPADRFERDPGPELPHRIGGKERRLRAALPVLRPHALHGGRGFPRHARFRAPDHLRSRPHLLPALHGARPEKSVDRTLAELLPADMVEQFARVRGENGIHHIYKFILRPAAMPFLQSRDVQSRDGNGAVNGHNGHGPATSALKESTL